MYLRQEGGGEEGWRVGRKDGENEIMVEIRKNEIRKKGKKDREGPIPERIR